MINSSAVLCWGFQSWALTHRFGGMSQWKSPLWSSEALCAHEGAGGDQREIFLVLAAC